MSVLSLADPFETVTGFARPNLSFNITPVDTKAGKFKRVREVVDDVGLPAFLQQAMGWASEPDTHGATLVVNVDCPLVARLSVAASQRHEAAEVAVAVWVDQARQASAERLSTDERLGMLQRGAELVSRVLPCPPEEDA